MRPYTCLSAFSLLLPYQHWVSFSVCFVNGLCFDCSHLVSRFCDCAAGDEKPHQNVMQAQCHNYCGQQPGQKTGRTGPRAGQRTL